MDLSHVFGFPLWEKAAFRRLDPDLDPGPNPDPNPNPNLNPIPTPSQAVFRLLMSARPRKGLCGDSSSERRLRDLRAERSALRANAIHHTAAVRCAHCSAGEERVAMLRSRRDRLRARLMTIVVDSAGSSGEETPPTDDPPSP